MTYAAGDPQINRLDGADRFEVAVNVSNAGWPNGSETVFISNYKAFADALSAAPLAYQLNAPILLTQKDIFTKTTRDEIVNLHPKKVYVVGGPGSVSDHVLNEIKKVVPDVKRIGGTDRFEVAHNIAKLMSPSNTVVVANGLKFPDALAIAPYASRKGYPILLTQSNVLPPKTKVLTEQASNTIVVGGEASVEPSVYNQLNSPQRIGGANRFEVAANIIRDLSPNTDKVFLATGLKFADALTGSVLAAKQQASLLLGMPDYLPDETDRVIDEKGINSFTILGGTGSIGSCVVGELKNVPLACKTIVLDPGHGGFDSGAVNGSYDEKTLNLQFSEKIKRHLESYGASVLMTRSGDVYLSLSERTTFANERNADLLISIHHNASYDENAKGVSTFYSTYRPGIDTTDVFVTYQGNRYPWVREDTSADLFYYNDHGTMRSANYNYDGIMAYDTVSPRPEAITSKNLAPVLDSALLYGEIDNNRGNHDQNLYLTRWANVPSVLIEAGFVSNDSEVRLLANQSVQEARAKKFATAVKHFLVNN